MLGTLAFARVAAVDHERGFGGGFAFAVFGVRAERGLVIVVLGAVAGTFFFDRVVVRPSFFMKRASSC